MENIEVEVFTRSDLGRIYKNLTLDKISTNHFCGEQYLRCRKLDLVLFYDDGIIKVIESRYQVELQYI
jgi:hypothetical protein